MQRIKHLAILLFGMTLLTYSCNNSSEKKDTPTPTEEMVIDSLVEANTETSVMDNEDDGDPNIKAASADTMEMVVDNHGNLVGRYVQTNQATFTVLVQDDAEVPRLGHKIVVYKAKNGQGIVYTLRKNVNVRKEPDLESPVITQITCADGDMPVTYPCLGKTKGWYKINVSDKIGYVRHDLVIWDGMDTF